MKSVHPMDSNANHSAVASDVPGSSSTDSFHGPGLVLLPTVQHL